MKTKKLNVKKVIIAICLLLFIIISIFCAVIGSKISGVTKESKEIKFVIKKQEIGNDIIDNLEDKKVIKSAFLFKVYMKFAGEINFAPGSYMLDSKNSMPEIYRQFKENDFPNNSKLITFKEGCNMRSVIKIITANTSITEKEILDKLKDKEYLKGLINDYWFLKEDILNDKLYYSLEGYLFPNTYRIDKDANIETIFKMMLDETEKELDKYEDDLNKSKYSVHQILSLASVVELEGKNKTERNNIASVFYNRLAYNMSLGSDPTSYYAVKKEIGEPIKQSELDSTSPYNTRNIYNKGIQIGPICNPGEEALLATIRPIKTDYLYFVSDNTGKTYFTRNSTEHNDIIAKLRREGKF